MNLDDVKKLIRDVPDFPKPGIVFKDITPVLKNAAAMHLVLDVMEREARAWKANLVAGPESRGFIFGAPLAARLGVGFVPIRKPKKLPWKTKSASYELEYGTDRVEIHLDAAGKGDRVVIVDDLLATGGTMGACCELVEGLGATVAGCLFMIELGFLSGRAKLPGRAIHSLLNYA